MSKKSAAATSQPIGAAACATTANESAIPAATPNAAEMAILVEAEIRPTKRAIFDSALIAPPYPPMPSLSRDTARRATHFLLGDTQSVCSPARSVLRSLRGQVLAIRRVRSLLRAHFRAR
jgi:hypothetical protein